MSTVCVPTGSERVGSNLAGNYFISVFSAIFVHRSHQAGIIKLECGLRQAFERKQRREIVSCRLGRIKHGGSRVKLSLGPRMAEARPEEMISSQILRSRPGVCC